MALQNSILDESLSLYLHALVNDLRHKGSMPTLFPPKDLQLEELNNLVRLVTFESFSAFYTLYNHNITYSFIVNNVKTQLNNRGKMGWRKATSSCICICICNPILDAKV